MKGDPMYADPELTQRNEYTEEARLGPWVLARYDDRNIDTYMLQSYATQVGAESSARCYTSAGEALTWVPNWWDRQHPGVGWSQVSGQGDAKRILNNLAKYGYADQAGEEMHF